MPLISGASVLLPYSAEILKRFFVHYQLSTWQLGDPGATRTPNQQNRNLSFYPLNYGTRLLHKNITKSPALQIKTKKYQILQSALLPL
jgi:hypothetical protein